LETKTSSLSKSQSLNEIQYENNEYLQKINNLANGCDGVKAMSLEQLDENLRNLSTCSNITKEELINSDNNLMEMSIDESSTASLGLLPSIMCSAISPFDTYNIPNILCETDFVNDNHRNTNVILNKNNINNDGDDDSENGIPTIQEEESDSNLTMIEMDERPVTPLIITNALNNSINSNDNCSLDNTMESINSTVVNQEMADELETMNLDNSINESEFDIKSTDSKMSIENNVDNSNKSETNIPLVDNSLHETKDNNAMGKDDKVLIGQNDKSLNDKSLKSSDLRVSKNTKSSVRPNSLTTTSRDTKLINNSEKVQRAASPSSKASIRKKIKTPGRWDAVMNKIEQSKTNLNQTNKTVKGRVNTNLHNGSMPKISPSSEFSIDIDSSHLTPSTPSVKSGFSTFSKTTTTTKGMF